MADVARRQLEFYNPRPLILGICFFWGAIMGFLLFYFSPPTQLAEKKKTSEPPTQLQPADTRRRWDDAPNITNVPDTPASVTSPRTGFENLVVEPPPVLLTTEGGITGKLASRPRTPTERPAPPATGPALGNGRPPPIPELMP